MMRADVHMHSTFSHDSDASPEQMILGAIEKIGNDMFYGSF